MLAEIFFKDKNTIGFSCLANGDNLTNSTNICHLLLDEQNTKKHWYKDYRILSNIRPIENALGSNPDIILN